MRPDIRTRRRALSIVQQVERLVRDEPDATVRLLILTLLEHRPGAAPEIRTSLTRTEGTAA